MILPIVAIVGRPNVGKSTLVNRIAQTNDAIVHEMRGVTRDRSYHRCDWNGVDFMLVDTGGIELASDDDFQRSIRNQALEATAEADVIVCVVDGQVGIQSDDIDVARLLVKSGKPIVCAVNKMDATGVDVDEAHIWEFYELGLGQPWPISAAHGHGTGDLLDEIVKNIPEGTYDTACDEDEIKIAIIGKPNAGKSSLTNRLVSGERSIVSPVSGTTRDAIDTLVVRNDTKYRIIDTAGLRKKSAISEDVEYYGFVRAMRAIERADVAILVIDSSVGVTNEDQRVASYAEERDCAMVIALNKWDLVEGPEAKLEVREALDEELQFVKYAPKVSISALSGKRVDRIWKAVDEAYSNFTTSISTSRLNRWLEDVKEGGHTVTKGKAILRIKYVTQTGTKPPRFTFFCNRPDIVTDNYRRFLANRLRATFDLTGSPIKLSFKKKD